MQQILKLPVTNIVKGMCEKFIFVIANNDIVCKSIMRQSTLPLYLYILDYLRVDKYNFK